MPLLFCIVFKKFAHTCAPCRTIVSHSSVIKSSRRKATPVRVARFAFALQTILVGTAAARIRSVLPSPTANRASNRM
uniref:Uncharacterized protein n=1 Tax=Anopheles dirus TaxID=7168 RepID=A0A182NWS8_9DIPT